VKKDHARLEELLAVYRELSDAERQEVDRHAQSCSACAARLADYRSIDRNLARLADPKPGEQLRQDFYSAIRLHDQRRAGLDGVWRRLTGLQSLAGLAFELAVVTLLMLGLGLTLRSRLEPSEVAPTLVPATTRQAVDRADSEPYVVSSQLSDPGQPAARERADDEPGKELAATAMDRQASPASPVSVVSLPVAQGDEEGVAYVVQADDTLWKLAEKYLGDGHRFPEIINATNAKHNQDASFALIEDADRITIGSKLWIPISEAPATSAEIAGKPSPTPASALSATKGAGGHIAFSFWNASPARCTYEIDVLDVAACRSGPQACQAKRLIFPLNNVSEPALSPSGDRLAFRGWGAPPSEDSPYINCAPPVQFSGLADSTLSGTAVRRMTTFLEDGHPNWSPDGQQILFDTGRNPDGIIRIMLVNADGTNERDLRIAGQYPAWASDGQRFVYRGCDLTGNRCGLWLAYAAPVKSWETGNNMIGPVVLDEQAAHPDWSPVSNQVVYQSPKGGSWDVYVANANSTISSDAQQTSPQQLTSDPAIEGLPSWSPDGQWIAYLSNSGGNWGIWIIRADGSGRQLLFAFDGGVFTPRAVEPYGQRDWIDEQISWSK
jgi:Tol biopolymer transport system component/anti-sigma factor RsiW